MNSTGIIPGAAAAANSTGTGSSVSLPVCLEDPRFHFVSHIGFSLLGASYLMRDPVWLRICIGVSNMILIFWGVLALPAWSCLSTILWNSLFTAINVQRWVVARRAQVSKKAADVAGDDDDDSGIEMGVSKEPTL